MTERQNNRQVSEYGRLMGIKELMAYTSLGRNSALELGKNACAIVRISFDFYLKNFMNYWIAANGRWQRRLLGNWKKK